MMRKFSERVEIRLGYRCNARCPFCYYLDSVTSSKGEPSTQQVLSRLRVMRKQGATEVEFTGGEPTIRKDIFELVAYATELGYINISFITNGLRLASKAFADRLLDAGANDFLFSIHGHNSELHDSQTQINGSFNKILAAVENVKSRGARCRGSTTVNGQNYKHVVDIVGKLVQLKMQCIHLAVFSPVAQADGANKAMFVTYSNATDQIKKAIDQHKHQLPPISVKYVPPCFMRGYEKHVMNLYQQSFDPDDWNYYLSQVVRRGDKWYHRWAVSSIALAGSVFLKDHSFATRHGVYGLRVFGVTRLVELLRKRRPKACKDCAYDNVCDHVWKDYIDEFGTSEFVPVPGKKISDPAWCYELASYREPGVRVATVSPPIVTQIPCYAIE
ncbi:MAG: radical SAM protein [Pseudomonadales bacterium]